MSCRTGSCGNLKLLCMARTERQSSSTTCKWWATSAEIMAAAVLLKCRINIWLKITKGYSLQIFQPHGQPMNIFDIQLRNEKKKKKKKKKKFLQPLAESSISSGSSPACQTSVSVHNYLAETGKKRKNTGHTEMNTSKHKSKKCAKVNKFDISTLMMYAREVRTDSYHNSASCRPFPQYSAININFDQPSYHCRSANTEPIESFVKHREDDFISRQIPPQANSKAPTHASECLTFFRWRLL